MERTNSSWPTNNVILSAAKDLTGAPMVMPPRSEGSGSMGSEILRCAQDDRAGAKGLAGKLIIGPSQPARIH